MKTLRNVLACAWVLWASDVLSLQDMGAPRNGLPEHEYILKERVTRLLETTDSQALCEARMSRFRAFANTQPRMKTTFECWPAELDPRVVQP